MMAAPPREERDDGQSLAHGGLARWSRRCEVIEAEPGRVFAFRTLPERIDLTRRDSTTWRYHFESGDDGTRVVHSYEITVPPLRLLRAVYGRMLPDHRDMRPQMAANLATLEQIVSASP